VIDLGLQVQTSPLTSSPFPLPPISAS